MADLFVSYSRSDADAVRRLCEALLARQREVWVDWRDIPPTAQWRNEIRAAIDAASAVVFVISPASITSEECRHELDHAVAQGSLPDGYRRLRPEVANPDQSQAADVEVDAQTQDRRGFTAPLRFERLIEAVKIDNDRRKVCEH